MVPRYLLVLPSTQTFDSAQISNSTIPAVACAVAAHKLGKPVRLVMDLRSNFEALGKRLPYLARSRRTKSHPNLATSGTRQWWTRI